MKSIKNCEHGGTNILDQIQELETKIDLLLPRGTGALKPKGLVGLVSEYSAIVSDLARREGPSLPSESDRERGQALADRPVFICGVPRSGTTLVQGLLHSHDRCLVLPSEGSFLTNLKQHFQSVDYDDAIHRFIREWISRLIAINSTEAHWILGRSSDGKSPYVRFVQRFLGWNISLARNTTKENICNPHSAVMLAFWSESATKDSATCWADKTPYNEFHARQLLKYYPDAKFIHVIRDPRAVIASRLRLQRRIGLKDDNLRQLLAEIRRSLKLALKYPSLLGPDRYSVVPYERLSTSPQETMKRVAEFLNFESMPSEFQPILHGGYSVKNTSYTDDPIGSNPIYLSSLDRHQTYLRAAEQQAISAALAVHARRCDYPVASSSLVSRLKYVSLEFLHQAIKTAKRLSKIANSASF